MMKKMIITLLLILTGLILTRCGMNIEKPSADIQKAFTEQFTNATRVEWEKEGALYKAEFLHECHEAEAWYDKDASWLRTKIEMAWPELPEVVQATIRDNTNEYWETDDISLYRQATGIPEYYYVELDRENSGNERQLRIRPDGTLITDLR